MGRLEGRLNRRFLASALLRDQVGRHGQQLFELEALACKCEKLLSRYSMLHRSVLWGPGTNEVRGTSA